MAGETLQLIDLPISPVDPESPVPLYHQIEEDLRRLITNGQIPSEAALPPEMELSAAYKVGRHTVRMALSRLASQNLISRHAGRGTFVKPQPDRAKFLLDRSFSRQMQEMGREARSKVLDIESGTISEESPEFFTDKINAKCLLLSRLRFGDDEPIGIQYSTILTERCPGLEKHDFNAYGLYDILAREYNLVVTKIRHTITATVADEFQAESLQIEVGDPLLVVNTATFLDNDDRFEYTISYYRADKYTYSTMHTYAA